MMSKRTERLAVIALLALYPMMGLSAVARKSPTYDEPAHLAAGYSIHAGGDHRVADPAHLPQWWFSLPLNWMDVTFVERDHDAWQRPHVELLGSELYYSLGNPPGAMTFAGRAMNMLLAMALGALVWWWSRSLFGMAGGLVSLGLFVFSPTMLAHGSLITADVAAALGLLLATWCLWRVLQRFTWPRVVVSGLAVGLLLLSKPSGVLIVPIAFLMLIFRRPRWGQTVLAVGAHMAICVVVIWGFYQFRYSAFKGDGAFRESWQEILPQQTVPAQLIGFSRDHRLLPEAYLYSLARFNRTWQGRKAFMNGRWTQSSWAIFFPYAVLVKTPIGAMAVISGGLFVLLRRRKLLGRTTPIWIFLAVYWFAAVTMNVNIGHRHILPTYPAMFILAGAVARWRWEGAPVVGVMALTLLVGESLWIRPHYLANFNALAGGPSKGYTHLVDSSLDWGQDLPGLKKYLDKHAQGQRVYLSYFGTADPATYGIEFIPLPGFILYQRPVGPPPFYRSGIYCISATMLQTTYLPYTGRWCRAYEDEYRELSSRSDDANVSARFQQLQFARLLAMLRQREPDAQIGYSILIYHLDEKDAVDAQLGKPAEFFESPGVEQ